MVKQQDVLNEDSLEESLQGGQVAEAKDKTGNPSSSYSRRDFLKVLGVSSGLAATGCAGDIPEKIIPYVVQPDEVVPGVASWYSGICSGCNAGCGVLVRVREGRAVKVEGNPNHPVNKGKLCALGQSTLQTLYDPDRIREPLSRELGGGAFKASSWSDSLGLVAEKIKSLPDGKKAVILSAPLSGNLKKLTKKIQSKLPALEVVEYETQNNEVLDLAAEASFGPGHRTNFDFSKAETVFSVGADFLESWISPVEFSRQWASRRRDEKLKSFFYQVEPRLSLTGANSDSWLMNEPGSELSILLELLKLVSKKKEKEAAVASLVEHFQKLTKGSSLGIAPAKLSEVAERLSASKASLVVAGGPSIAAEDSLSAAVLANAINSLLGNIGASLTVTSGHKKAESSADKMQSLISRAANEESDIGLLLISGLNPVFSVPKSEGFEKALGKIPFIVSLATNLDETASFSNVVLPLSTSFESWFDNDSRDGFISLNQPAMRPLYETQSLADTLLSLAGILEIEIPSGDNYFEYLKASWQKQAKIKNKIKYQTVWDDFVQSGLITAGPQKKSVTPKLNLASVAALKAAGPLSKDKSGPSAVMAFPTIASLDGSSANRPWLQELPNPMTSVVWGTWAEINSEVSKELGIKEGDIVQIRTESGAIEASAFPTDNIHPALVAVPIGQGHKSMGRYANGVGANPLSLMSKASSGAKSYITKLGDIGSGSGRNDIVKTQDFEDQQGRGILRTVSASTLAASHGGHDDHSGHGKDSHGDDHGKSHDTPDKHHAGGHHDPLALGPQDTPPQMYEQMKHPNYRWGMSIDLAACTGCSACVVACYAENNIPVVGKEFCSQGREMSWLRVDRYSDSKDSSNSSSKNAAAHKSSHSSHEGDPAHADSSNAVTPENSGNPITGFQPMMCQHCGNAPCEPVCPVYATYHNEEGLNSMVYNRCVGTRYCSNNCSYKVRRFNWFDYTWPEPLNWQLNPDVTVRTVGVMEKCTFCVQRVREGTNNAKNEGRLVNDGEIQPACASTCPTDAITFGNLKDKNSKVYKNSQSKRGYKVLDSVINTQPAITYLAKITE